VVIGAVIALEMVIGSVGVPRATPVIEQTQDDFRQLPLINRETPPSLETDAPVNDREQLRRYRGREINTAAAHVVATARLLAEACAFELILIPAVRVAGDPEATQ